MKAVWIVMGKIFFASIVVWILFMTTHFMADWRRNRRADLKRREERIRAEEQGS